MERTSAPKALGGEILPPGAEPLQADDPAVLDGHRLTGRLSAGGTSIVYLARDPAGEHVAVKTTRPRMADQAQARRWLRTEAACVRRLPAFCTARLVSDGSDHVPPYLASEYVEGPSLEQFVEVLGPLEPEQVEALAAALARALAAVHDAGLVHCDLKPANVMLAADGPRVIDFSIAQDAPVAGRPAEVGAVPYSPGWVAPERLSGHPPGPAADVFGWGCLLGYAATGHSPFDTDGTGPRSAADPSALAALDGHVRVLVEAALAADPADRPSAGEIVARLAALETLDGTSLPAPQAALAAQDDAAWQDAPEWKHESDRQDTPEWKDDLDRHDTPEREAESDWRDRPEWREESGPRGTPPLPEVPAWRAESALDAPTAPLSSIDVARYAFETAEPAPAEGAALPWEHTAPAEEAPSWDASAPEGATPSWEPSAPAAEALPWDTSAAAEEVPSSWNASTPAAGEALSWDSPASAGESAPHWDEHHDTTGEALPWETAAGSAGDAGYSADTAGLHSWSTSDTPGTDPATHPAEIGLPEAALTETALTETLPTDGSPAFPTEIPSAEELFAAASRLERAAEADEVLPWDDDTRPAAAEPAAADDPPLRRIDYATAAPPRAEYAEGAAADPAERRPRRLRTVAMITAPAALVAVLATVIAVAGTGSGRGTQAEPDGPVVTQGPGPLDSPAPIQPVPSARTHRPHRPPAAGARRTPAPPLAAAAPHTQRPKPSASSRPAHSHSPGSPHPTHTSSPPPTPTPSPTPSPPAPVPPDTIG